MCRVPRAFPNNRSGTVLTIRSDTWVSCHSVGVFYSDIKIRKGMRYITFLDMAVVPVTESNAIVILSIGLFLVVSLFSWYRSQVFTF